MKILIQTGMTLPEVTEEELKEIYIASAEGEVILVHNDADALQHLPDTEVMMGIVNQKAFPLAKNLKWLHSTAAGADMLMYPEMVDSQIVITGEKGMVGDHLSDHAFGHLLVLTRQLRRAIEEIPNSWPSRLPMRRVMFELSGSTAGIVGFGGTGIVTARKAKAFGMNTLAVDSEKRERTADLDDEVWAMDRFFEMLSRCDVVFICCPLTKETRGLFNDAAFDAMKPNAILINVTRGPIVDLDSIIRALEQGKIAGAGLDVTPIEPLPADCPLWAMPNVMITPHTAGASQFRAGRNVRRFIANLRHYRAGEPLEGEIDKQKGF